MVVEMEEWKDMVSDCGQENAVEVAGLQGYWGSIEGGGVGME